MFSNHIFVMTHVQSPWLCNLDHWFWCISTIPIVDESNHELATNKSFGKVVLQWSSWKNTNLKIRWLAYIWEILETLPIHVWRYYLSKLWMLGILTLRLNHVSYKHLKIGDFWHWWLDHDSCLLSIWNYVFDCQNSKINIPKKSLLAF